MQTALKTQPEELMAPELTANGLKVLEKRYIERVGDEPQETAGGRLWAVAMEVARGSERYGQNRDLVAQLYYAMMAKGDFLPNSPTLMNAGKGNGLQLSACYVLPVGDSMEEIFETVKRAALIHKSGGGCIGSSSRVWSTFCGLEPISVLFERATVGRSGQVQGNGVAFDVSDLDIQTVAQDQQTGMCGLQKVTHLWKFNVPAEHQYEVKTKGGASVQTSAWHPFMVLDGAKLVERRADELQPGDVILRPTDPTAYWPWAEYREVGGRVFDDDAAWLTGFVLGNGSFDYSLNGRRLRAYSNVRETIDRATQILSMLGTTVTSQPHNNMWQLATCSKSVVQQVMEWCGVTECGAKVDVIRVPEWVGKSPLSVVWAFIGGLMDSDGYVDKRGRLSYSTVSENMALDLASLLGLVGFSVATHKRPPYGKGKQLVYDMTLGNDYERDELVALVGPNMSHGLRGDRFKDANGIGAVTLNIHPWIDMVRSVGIIPYFGKVANGLTDLGKLFNRWAACGSVRRQDAHLVVDVLRATYPDQAALLERIARYGVGIVSVGKAERPEEFYDMSVENWNTYAAGIGGMVMVHNTGFSFSRLRPAGDTVGTTGGVASGPISFMEVFNAATEQVKQGGCFVGSTLVATADGPVPLKDLKGGTMVYAWDDEYKLVPCTTSWLTKRNAEVWKLTTDKGLIVYATPDHPFMTSDGTYTKLSALEPGQRLKSLEGGYSVERVRYSHQEDVYNVEIPGPHNYIVCDENRRGVVVSNTRRGANMGVLRVDHPDILDFIQCKREPRGRNKEAFDAVAPTLSPEQVVALKRALLEGQISNFNISVAITDEFMNALKHDYSYALIHPVTGKEVKRLRAREVFQLICECAWETGDPGLLFIDRINNSPSNPVPTLEQIEASNPCGEQNLSANDVCNLASINLGHCVSEDGKVIWTKLESLTRLGTRFLDDVITVNLYPDKQTDEKAHANRRLGLGVMGWADMLIKMGIPYDSEDAIDLGRNVMAAVTRWAHDESYQLAEEREPFPNFDNSIYATGRPMRNGTLTTVAPTGTISIIAGCSSGIEPMFALCFDRKGSLDGALSLETYEPFVETAKREGFWSDELAEDLYRHGTVRGLKGVPEKWQRVFGTAHDIAPEWHIRMQAAFQEHTDNSISKTINLPHDATVADIEAAYKLAWETGCKGTTVYRDGSKVGVLHVGDGSAPAPAVEVVHARSDGSVNYPPPLGEHNGYVSPRGDVVLSNKSSSGHLPAVVEVPVAKAHLAERPSALTGQTHRIETPLGSAYITINEQDGEPFEVFVNQGKAGSDIAPLSEAIGKLVSMLLRVPSSMDKRARLQSVARKLRGIGGSGSIGFGIDRTRSLPDALAKVLGEYLEPPGRAEETPEAPTAPLRSKPAEPRLTQDFCPECGTVLASEENCRKCYHCGYSAC